MAKKKDRQVLPINRTPHFYSENSMNTDMLFIRQYYDNDINMEITLYRINLITSEVDDLYGEALPMDKKFFPPVNLTVLVDMGESVTGNEKGLTLETIEFLNFDVLISELKSKNCEVNRGDIVSYYTGDKVRYFEVMKANNISDTSGQAMIFRKGYYKHIECTMIKDDVILKF